MGAMNALPPEGQTVMVDPDTMVQALSQWMDNRRAGRLVMPIPVEFKEHEIEFIPVRVSAGRICRKRCPGSVN